MFKKLIFYIISRFHQCCILCEYWQFIREDDYQVNQEIIWPGSHGWCSKIDDISQDCNAWTSSTCEKNRVKREDMGCESSLITKPNFGCQYFKRRENKNAK